MIKNSIKIFATAMCLLFAGCVFTSCKEEVEIPTSGVLTFETEERTIMLDEETQTAELSFISRQNWQVDVEPGAGDWLSISPVSGVGGSAKVKFGASSNNGDAPRSVKIHVKALGGQTEEFIVTQAPSGLVVLRESDVQDFEKYYKPQEFSGMDMLRSDAKWSWVRSKQSQHFVVFWEAGFGSDPNSADVPAALRVDIDDLLQKAEKFFDTNINKIGMATLGQGKSVLDDYKMEIYLLYQTEWLATGSGYDDTIGALWVNPSTCQPVGSTIAHEIGHSFQYQTYADRVNKQGVPNDFTSGFRYGFTGPDGSGNGGCAYWEQCAQWQAQRDYPIEQFESYNYQVWLNNCHRHFHHEWQRYASYWLQSYFVQKHGMTAYGRIWTESKAPEDAISTYTRIYNGGDYSKTREELFDYAVRMATYDIDDVREYASGYQGRYDATFVTNDKGEYQIAYSSCPGATGFNVIELTAPSNGGKVTVSFRGLGYGETLQADDKSKIVDGDGNVKGTPTRYNAVGGADQMGWRYGFVALKGETRTYGEVGKDANGSLSFNVPAGADRLFLVVQGSPESYMSHGWDEEETNDPQFPYAITLEGTDLKKMATTLKASYAVQNDVLVGTINASVSLTDSEWIFATYDVAEKEVAEYLGVAVKDIEGMIVQPVVGEKQTAQEGKIVVFNEQSDGSLWDMPTANVGYWLDKKGDAVSWGSGQSVYYEINGTVMTLGKLGADTGALAGETFTMRPVFVYTKNGVAKKVKYVINYNFK